MISRLFSIFLAASVGLWSGCTAREPQRPLPSGTPVSGAVKNQNVRTVVYIPAGKQTGVAMEVVDTGKEISYRSAVPPGEYDVYAYITGARAHVSKVSVGQQPVTVDIPESLQWKEALDQHAGTMADVARPK